MSEEKKTEVTQEPAFSEAMAQDVRKLLAAIEEEKKYREQQKKEIPQNEIYAINPEGLQDEINEDIITKQRIEMLEVMAKADRAGKIDLMHFDTDAMAAYYWHKKFEMPIEEIAKKFDDLKNGVVKFSELSENYLKEEEARNKINRVR